MNELPPTGNGPQPELDPHEPLRSGISPEMLRLAGVCSVTAEQAEVLTGKRAAGVYIPFRDLDGNPIPDFGRLRLTRVEGNQKYHQRAGSLVHAYLPPGLVELPIGGALIVIEGEFKALALREAGYLAVGITGFYGFARERSSVLAPELDAALSRFKPTVVHFCGDTDATTNYQFYDAALKLGTLLRKLPQPPKELFLTCVPVNSPAKGFDDAREVRKDAFNEWFNSLLNSSYPLGEGLAAAGTLVARVKCEQANFKSLKGSEKEKAERNLLKAAAACASSDPLRHEEIITLFSETFGSPKSTVRKAVKVVRAQWNTETATKKNRQATSKLPAHIPLPSDGSASITESAKVLFEMMKLKGIYYRQGAGVVVVNAEGKSAKLEPVSLESLRSRAENLAVPLKRAVMTRGGTTFEQANMSMDDAKALLASEQVKQLDFIRGVLPLPILTLDSNKQPRMLGPGYDAATQLFITTKDPLPPLPPVSEAVETIKSLFVDFCFQDASDQSRAVSMFLTLALTVAGVLPGLNPMFVIEADNSQTGKGLLTSLLANVFRLRIAAIAQHPGRGLGSQEDSFYAALELGQPLVVFDNWRGKLSCPALEQFMTQRSGGFPVRVAYKAQREVDPAYYLLALTSNGCELTPDQANRSVLIRLLKQREDYAFPSFPEGDFPAHVLAHWQRYACAIFSVLTEWFRLGSPKTNVQYNSFTLWAQSLDWIVKNLFALPPLLAGMQEEKARISSPNLSFVRSIAIAVAQAGRLGHKFTAAALAEVADDVSVPIPHESDGDHGGAKGIGICMASVFKQRNCVQVDAYTVKREVEMFSRKDSDEGGDYEGKVYIFSKTPQQPAATAATLPE